MNKIVLFNVYFFLEKKNEVSFRKGINIIFLQSRAAAKGIKRQVCIKIKYLNYNIIFELKLLLHSCTFHRGQYVRIFGIRQFSLRTITATTFNVGIYYNFIIYKYINTTYFHFKVVYITLFLNHHLFQFYTISK